VHQYFECVQQKFKGQRFLTRLVLKSPNVDKMGLVLKSTTVDLQGASAVDYTVC